MAKQTGGGVPDIAGLLAQVKAGVQGVTTAALAGLTVVTKEVNAFARSFVEAFRPDVVKRFDLAARDLTATIGEILVPVMQIATVVIREMGSVLNGLSAATKGIRDEGFALLLGVLKSVGGVVMDLVNATAADFIPIQKAVLKVVKDLAPVFAQLFAAVAPVVGAVMEFQAAIFTGLMPALAAVGSIVKVAGDLIGGLLPIVIMPFKMLAAVIGPIVQVALLPLTAAMQLLSAVMQPFASVFKAFGQAIDDVSTAVGDLVKDSLNAFMTIVGDLFKAFSDLFEPMREFVRTIVQNLIQGIADAVRWIVGVIKQLRELLGLPTQEVDDMNKDNTGKAARGVNFGSPDEMWRAVVKATAGAGRSEPVDNIRKDVSDLKKTMGDMAKNMEKVANNTTPRATGADPKMADLWRNQELRRG